LEARINELSTRYKDRKLTKMEFLEVENIENVTGLKLGETNMSESTAVNFPDSQGMEFFLETISDQIADKLFDKMEEKKRYTPSISSEIWKYASVGAVAFVSAFLIVSSRK
jgi:hypothetical protein